MKCEIVLRRKVRISVVVLMSGDVLRISHDNKLAASCSRYADFNFPCAGTKLSAGLYNKALEAKFSRVWLYYFLGLLVQMPLVAK